MLRSPFVFAALLYAALAVQNPRGTIGTDFDVGVAPTSVLELDTDDQMFAADQRRIAELEQTNSNLMRKIMSKRNIIDHLHQTKKEHRVLNHVHEMTDEPTQDSTQLTKAEEQALRNEVEKKQQTIDRLMEEKKRYEGGC